MELTSRARVALVVLVACNAPDRGPRWRAAGNVAPRDGGTLRVAVPAQVRTLDPTIAYDDVSSIALHALFDTLVDYEPATADPDREVRIVPRLAERWEITPDGLAYTFHLRAGITFSDGTAIGATNVKLGLERALTTPDSPFGPFLANIVGAKLVVDGATRDCAGITTPTERELVIRLVKPDMSFLYILAMSFTTPQHAGHLAAVDDQIRRRPLASGPYVLDRWDEGQRIVLRRNPSYWDRGRAHLDRIEVRENIPRDTQFLMFETGELDAAEKLSAPDHLWITGQPEWQPFLHRRALMNAFGSRMNVRKKPFDDRRVRQALNYAVNKHHSVKLLGGTAVMSHGLLAPGMFGRDRGLQPYPYDPAKARALLAEAGYPSGFTVEYVVMNDEEAERLAASLQADLAEVGVTVNISVMTFSTYATAIGNPEGSVFSKGVWVGDYADPTSFFDVLFHSRMIADANSNNSTFYANPELDALLDAARGEHDPARREAMYIKAERILYDDAPWIWDYHQMLTEVTQPYVRGYEPHPVWQRDYTSAWLDLGPDGERLPR